MKAALKKKKKRRGFKLDKFGKKIINSENDFNMCKGCVQDQVTKELYSQREDSDLLELQGCKAFSSCLIFTYGN